MKELKDNPCIDCTPPKRYPGCHSKCGEYIVAKAFHDAERSAEYQDRDITQYSIDNARKYRDIYMKKRQNFRGCKWRHA